MIVSVKPEAFWNRGCIAFKVKQGPNEGTEKNDSAISVCSCSKPSGVVIRFLELGLAELAPPSWPCPWLISAVPAGRLIAECGTIRRRNAETRCRRKLLRGTRRRATRTVALP